MLIGIDLLWVKVNQNGGVESYIRNLLRGFKEYSGEEYKFILFTAKDNDYSFENIIDHNKFSKVVCNIESMKVGKRILWENINLGKYAKKYNVDVMFVPVYSKPLFRNRNVKYLITVHDLQALHYPEYFSKKKYLWMKYAWKRCTESADRIVAISNFVKEDIVARLQINRNKIDVIYNPIAKSGVKADFDLLGIKYNIEKKKFLYTVSSMYKHKNLITLLKVAKEAKERNLYKGYKFVISGVGGQGQQELESLIKEYNIEDKIIFTGFISDEERDTLYENSAVFLFPSIFEGFGMPPIEAMELGTPVVTTTKASLLEVTKGEAFYVEDPYNTQHWIERINEALASEFHGKVFEEYSLSSITKQYFGLFEDLARQ